MNLKTIFCFLMLIVTQLIIGQQKVLPSFQEWEPSSGYFKINQHSKIICNEADYKLLKNDLERFKNDLELILGITLIISSENARKGDILFSLEANNPEIGNEGYSMNVSNYISVKANKNIGAFYGMQSLLQLFKQSHKLNKGMAIDYPKIAERGFMIDCGRKYFEIEYIEKLIRNMAYMKLNFIHLHFTEWNGFRLKSELFPGLASDKAYSKEDIRRIQDYAAQYYITVVPEIDIPAHSTAITDYNPYLGFKCQSMRESPWQGEEANRDGKAWALDVTKPEVKSWLRALLDEWIPLFDGPYFHIGGDEWQYDREKYQCPELVQATKDKGYQYPGDLYVEWINEINAQVKSYGKTTQIWNWWRFSPNEEKQNKTSIQPDKDIVINIWNSPRKNQILEDGYKSIITTEEGNDALYITPGLHVMDEKKPNAYGVFPTKKIYEEWQPDTHKNVIGFKVCLWADGAENQSDDWFEQFYELPIAVFSERTWGSPKESSLEVFQLKYNIVGKTVE